jgi:hypothetical protein
VGEVNVLCKTGTSRKIIKETRGAIAMSLTEEVIDAVLEADGSLRLSHSPTISPGPVRVTISTVSPQPKRGMADVIREIAAEQRARGYMGRSAEELKAEEELQHEEDEERDREQESARQKAGPGVP